MRIWIALCLSALPLLAQAEACVVHSKGAQVEVKVCQQNRTIPANLFHNGFCQPQLTGQTVDVSYAEQCPAGAFGVCRNARVSGSAYQQDIHYYGVATDARLLKPACEQQSKGVWMAP
jgi:hypothetical protein